MPDDYHDGYFVPLPDDVQAYLHIVPQVTITQTVHGCLVKMIRQIGGHEFQAEVAMGAHIYNLDQLEAIVNQLRAHIARQIEKIL